MYASQVTRITYTAPDPKLGILSIEHYWITKVRSEVPFRIPCSLPSVVLGGYIGV